MAQSGYTPIQLFHSTTPGNMPTTAELLSGELALNAADGKLYYLSTSGTVSSFVGGSSGSSGLSGYSGYSGYSGLGLSGYSGYSGVSGYSGSPGSGGTSGLSGFSGYSGSGVSGYSGYSGYSGLGLSGYSGISGYSGAPGSSILNTANNFTNTNTFATSVSIGSTSTPATLYVKGGNSNNIIVDNAGQQFTTVSLYNNGSEKGQWYWDQSNNIMVFGTDVSAALEFKTATVQRMQISATGGVSIGTSTDPGQNNLLVNGTIQGNSHNTTNFTISESGGKLYFAYQGANIASLDSSGNFTTLNNVTAYGTP